MNINAITEILIDIFSPQIFWPIIGIISIASIIVVIFSIIADRKIKTSAEDIQDKLEALEKDVSSKDTELKGLKDKFKAKEADYRHQLKKLEEQINENEANRIKVKGLEIQVKEKDEKIKAAQPETEKYKKEASLKLEMYNGLKSQYDELEAQTGERAKKLETLEVENKKSQQEIVELKKKLEAQTGERAKKLETLEVENKKSQQEIAELKKKLEEATPTLRPSGQVSQQPKKEEAPQASPSVGEFKISKIDKQKQTAEKPEDVKKDKTPPSKSEAKVRLAQVMQEAAKVSAKIEEKKKSKEESEDSSQQKKEDSKAPPSPPEADPPSAEKGSGGSIPVDKPPEKQQPGEA